MNPRKRSFWRKIIYLVAIAVLLGLLSWLGRPSTTDTPRAKGSRGGILAQIRDDPKNPLSQTQLLGQIDPTSETIKLATLGMRGIAANILWTKANTYKMKKDFINMAAAVKQLAKLQPNFISVWIFQAWNFSYNVSVEFDDFRDRYRWVIQGINFLKEGMKYNGREPRLQWEAGWYLSQKIGRSDERKQFRRLFKHDDEFHGDRPLDWRDNWLVAKEWFRKAEELVDNLGVSMRGKSALLYRSDAPKCQMSYAEAIESEGTFGPVASRAWGQAAEEWDQYGSVDLPTSLGINIRLNEQERFEESADRLSAEIDKIAPGLREKIAAEKEAKLTDQQRKAREIPIEKRTREQYMLAREAEEAAKVTDEDVARRITGPRRREAIELAEQAADDRKMAKIIHRNRQIVNFVYWRSRADIEQRDETISAREFVYDGDQAAAEADLLAAKDLYDRGLAAWRRILDKHSHLPDDETFGSDMMEVIDRYRWLLDQLEEPFPEDFILQDIIDKHGPKQE